MAALHIAAVCGAIRDLCLTEHPAELEADAVPCQHEFDKQYNERIGQLPPADGLMVWLNLHPTSKQR